MIFVDTNVFVLALRYPRDVNAAENARFLEWLASCGGGITSVVNVLETCGVLSFNLNRRQLRSLYAYFGRHFAVEIVPQTTDGSLVPASPAEVLGYVARRLSLGDALVAQALDLWAPDATHFVSWDARHFRGKLCASVTTPSEFLAAPPTSGGTAPESLGDRR